MKGKVVSVLTSMTDPLRLPGEKITHFYSQSWEIELGYREIKQAMLGREDVLRNKRSKMIAQEL